MPPIESPANANRAGAACKTFEAKFSIVSAPINGLTMTGRYAERDAIWGANSRASHIMPGRNKRGVTKCLQRAPRLPQERQVWHRQLLDQLRQTPQTCQNHNH